MRAEIESLRKVAAKVQISSLHPEVGSDFAADVIDPVKSYANLRFSTALPPKSPSTRVSASSGGEGVAGAASRRPRPSTGGAKSINNSETPGAFAAAGLGSSSISSNQSNQTCTLPAGRVVAPPRRRSPTAAAAAAYSTPSPLRTRPSSSSSHITPSVLRSRPSSSHTTPLSAPPSLITHGSTSAARGSRSRSKDRSRERSASRDAGTGYASSHDLRSGYCDLWWCLRRQIPRRSFEFIDGLVKFVMAKFFNLFGVEG
jgi:hypothetical protein